MTVFAWWFLYINMGAYTVGPFGTQEQCEAVRKAAGGHTLPCWSSGEMNRSAQ